MLRAFLLAAIAAGILASVTPPKCQCGSRCRLRASIFGICQPDGSCALKNVNCGCTPPRNCPTLKCPASRQVTPRDANGCPECPICSRTVTKVYCDEYNPCTGGHVCVHGQCSQQTYLTCDSTDHCPNGEECVNGECLPLVVPCNADHSCPGSEICVNGACEPGATCTSNNNCGEYEQCVNGQCQTLWTGCDVSRPCPAGSSCVNGECQPLPVPPASVFPNPDGQGSIASCDEAHPCPEGEFCFDGDCGAGPVERCPTITGNPSYTVAPCQTGYHCVDEFCRKCPPNHCPLVPTYCPGNNWVTPTLPDGCPGCKHCAPLLHPLN